MAIKVSALFNSRAALDIAKDLILSRLKLDLMNHYQQQFRSQTFSSIFTMVGKTFKELMVGGGLYVLFTVVSLLPIIGVLATIDWSPFMQMSTMEDPEMMGQLMMQTMTDIMANFGSIELLLFCLSMILIMISGAWYTTYTMLAVEVKVKGHKWPVSQLIQHSFSTSVLWVFLFQVFIIFMYFFVMGLGALTGNAIHPSLILLLLLGFVLIIMKFIQSQPAIVHRELGVGQAISYSNAKVSVGQAFKYVGIAVLAVIGSFVAIMMIFIVGAMLAMVPVIGPVLYLALNFIVNFIFLAMINITQSVLYYKYSEDLEQGASMDLDEHLMA